MRTVLIICCLISIVMGVHGQGEMRTIKDAISNNDLKRIKVLVGDSFTPGEKITLNFEVESNTGVTAKASDSKFLWKEADIFVSAATMLEAGQYKAFDGYHFYPNKPLKIAIELANVSDSVNIFPSFCYEKFVVERSGPKGASGYDGMQGRDGFGTSPPSYGGRGMDASPGGNGDDIDVVVSEEIIGDVAHIILDINGQKHPVRPGCGIIRIESKGGNGGAGGRGGNGGDSGRFRGRYMYRGADGGPGGNGGRGGNGGTIRISGPAYEKYASKIELLSPAGFGGKRGSAGFGGYGQMNGFRGEEGNEGQPGEPGRIIRGDFQKQKPNVPLKTTIVVTCDTLATLFLNGKQVVNLQTNKPTKLIVHPGKVFVEVRSANPNSTVLLKEELTISEGEQVIRNVRTQGDPK